MPIARFEDFPPLILKDGFPNNEDTARFEALEEIYNSLPIPVKLLFSFNTWSIIYYTSCQRFGLFVRYAAYMDYDLSGSAKPSIRICELIGGESAPKILIHELAHTLDSFVDSGESHQTISPNHFPAWLRRAAQRWKNILEQEPDSPELNQGLSDFERAYIKKPNEQWANRLALTLIADFMVPAGLVEGDDIARRQKLSAEQFKAKWPKTYKFFHKYIQTILARAKNHKL